jgi:iron complex outermembrane receptor protein
MPRSLERRARICALIVGFLTPNLPAVAAPLGYGALAAPPRVVGVVRDTSGNPLGGVDVIIASLNRTSVTNDSGRFVFTGLPAGNYHVSTLMLGRAPGHTDVTVPASGPDVTVVITLKPARAVQLSTVNITATPVGTDPRDVAQSTISVGGLDLSKALSSTIAQTLSSEPGVNLRFMGPAATAPVIRGLSGERVLVLQDGDRAGDLSATSSDHSVSIDPLTAKRIEVVRGPASLLYGNNALGGVVNVISNDLPTSIPTHVDGYITTQSESATPGGGAAAGVTVPVSSTLAFVARGEGRHTDDMRMGGGATLPNSYFRNYSGVGGLGFANATTSGGVLGRAYGFTYGLPSADNEGSHITGHRYEGTGRLELGALGPFTSLRINGAAQTYAHDEIESTGEVGTSFSLKTQTVDFLGRTRLGRTTGAVGASGLFKQYASTGEEALTPAANSNGVGAFIYEEVPLVAASDPDARVPRFQVGARYDRYGITSLTGDSKFGSGRDLTFTNVSGSLGFTVPVGEVVTLAISGARAFRAPTVEELFANAFHAALGSFDVGNPDLKVETNQGVDGSIRISGSKVTAQFAGYFNRVNNFITPLITKDTVINAGQDTVPLNHYSQADADLKGVEAQLDVEVTRHVVLGVIGDAVRGTLAGGSPLPFMPGDRLGGHARYDDGRWSLQSELRHGFAQTRVPPPVSPDDPSGVSTEKYDLLNLSGGRTFNAAGRLHSITFRVDNALDEQYKDATSRIKDFAFNTGRNFALVYRVVF